MTSATDPVEQRIDSLLVGAIDPHVHSGPSIAARKVDHLELAREASKAGMAAIVTKDHDYAGVMTAWLINKHFPELTTKVYSSIVLNNVVGGLNPYAVEHTAAMGGKVVWLPTLTAEQHFKWEKTSGWVHPASTSKIRPATAIPVLDANRRVLDATKEILDVVAKADIALASGHIHASETRIVFEEAKKRGVTRLIFTHPEDIVGGTFEDAREIAAMGAYVEHSLCMFLEGCKFKSRESAELDEWIKAAGVDRTMMCSDLGQVGTFDPVDGLRRGMRLCIEFGYSDDDIRKMFSLNTARVLGIESDLPMQAAAQ
jgi:hypothetical protein